MGWERRVRQMMLLRLAPCVVLWPHRRLVTLSSNAMVLSNNVPWIASNLQEPYAGQLSAFVTSPKTARGVARSVRQTHSFLRGPNVAVRRAFAISPKTVSEIRHFVQQMHLLPLGPNVSMARVYAARRVCVREVRRCVSNRQINVNVNPVPSGEGTGARFYACLPPRQTAQGRNMRPKRVNEVVQSLG